MIICRRPANFRPRPPKPFKRSNGIYYLIQQFKGMPRTWRSLRTRNKKEAEELACSIWHEQQLSFFKVQTSARGKAP